MGRLVDVKTRFSLLRQRIRESKWAVHSGLFLLMIAGFLQALLGQRAKAVRSLSQVHRTTRANWMKRRVEGYVFANRQTTYSDRTTPSSNLDIRSTFGTRLMVLKAPGTSGEKGVLFVMFTEIIQALHISMDLPRLLNDYTLVFEPSWSGYCNPEFLRFTQFGDQIFILAAEQNDFAFLRRLGSNLIPVDLGPCDWVDPRVAVPYLGGAKEFDIVMNSNWAAWKRHYVLFRMLGQSKQRYRVALIGVPWQGKTLADIERLANFYGVRDQIRILERLPYDKVMEITCRSKVSILLSLKEGSNRAIAESMFCDVPVLVLSDHIGGIRKNIVAQTGVLADERCLEPAVDALLRSATVRPRDWAIENVSCFKSSEKLNSLLKEYALRSGRPWTEDIAGRSSSPESKYINDEDAERLRPWNHALESYLTAR